MGLLPNLSRLLALVCCPILAPGPVGPARADGGVPAPWLAPVAVLDARDLSAYGGRMLSRRAGDAVALALSVDRGWQAVERRAVRVQCAQLGLEPPFAAGHCQQIAHLTGAHLAVSCVIRQVTLAPETRTARVALSVEMVDVVAGEPIALGAAEASASGAAGRPMDAVVEQALLAAATDAVGQLGTAGTRRALVRGRLGRDMLMLQVEGTAPLPLGLHLLIYRRAEQGSPAGNPIAICLTQETSGDWPECRVVKATDSVRINDQAFGVGER